LDEVVAIRIGPDGVFGTLGGSQIEVGWVALKTTKKLPKKLLKKLLKKYG